MALDLPETADEVAQRSLTDVQRELTGSNPFLPQSWLGAIVIAAANRIFDFYIQLKQAINLSFPDTTSGDFLDRWASIWGVPRLSATKSSGSVVVTGTTSTSIPIATTFQSSNGLTYTSTNAATITDSVLSVTEIVRVGNLVTVTTTTDHGIASNVTVTIVGATQTDYNGEQTIIVTGADQFQYEISTTPVTPATGTITVTFTSASVSLQSNDFDSEDLTVNQPLDAILTLGSPISGADNDASVDFDGLEAGIPQESDEGLRIRFLDRVQNPVANFSVADIVSQSKQINGVTRVFVEPSFPSIGQVTVFFMRDNDANPIPTSTEVAAVKAALLEILPAQSAEIDLIVLAPTAVSTDFIFSDITPNTLTMQTSVSATLAQFFTEGTSVGVDVDGDKYRSAIINTVDTDTGDKLETFVLTTPIGDISVSLSEIATLGTITFL